MTVVAFLSIVTGLPEPEAGFGIDQINTLSRVKRGGACETTKDCVAGNVCSKWGWCQWTSIYGSDGPSQGAAAPGKGKAGQCVTSADCASRVPYCSKLGFCHGGRLPFDEAQLEIPDEDKTNPFPQQPQGFINNNPPKNNPIINGKSNGGKKGGKTKAASRGNPSARRQGSSGSKSSSRSGGSSRGRSSAQTRGGNRSSGSSGKSRNGGGSKCPGGNAEACVGACDAISQLKAYTACVKQCGKRC